MKAICIIRTSTDRQRIEEQTAEVIQMAKNDGFADENIIVVGECGASAIKLDEAYRKNLDRLYKLLETEQISCVYAWAIDRIGRNEEVLMRLKNTLVKRRIQLKIKNPSLTLFNTIGQDLTDVNAGMELAFALFATMSKQEMEQKKERFRRGKRQNGKVGKYIGGNVPYGYTIDEHNRYVPEPSESLIVKKIYNMFASGKYSLKTLTEELRIRDIRHRNNKHFTLTQVRLVLYLPSYVGRSDGLGIATYPRIISDELWQQTREILARNRNDYSQQSKHTYFANKLIICPECGYHFVGNGRIYRCVKHSNKKAWSAGRADFEPCHNDMSIAIPALDNLLLDVARQKHTEYLYADLKERNQYIENENVELSERIAGLDVIISKYTSRKKKIRDIYLSDDDYTEDEYKTDIQKLNAEFDGYKNEKMNLEERIRRNNEILTASDKESINDIYNKLIDVNVAILNSNDERQYADLVKQYVREVKLSKYESTEKDKEYIMNHKVTRLLIKRGSQIKAPSAGIHINIICVDGSTESYIYYGGMRNGKLTKFYRFGSDGIIAGAQPRLMIERYGDICKISKDEPSTVIPMYAELKKRASHHD